jgi:hypothetical protein
MLEKELLALSDVAKISNASHHLNLEKLEDFVVGKEPLTVDVANDYDLTGTVAKLLQKFEKNDREIQDLKGMIMEILPYTDISLMNLCNQLLLKIAKGVSRKKYGPSDYFESMKSPLKEEISTFNEKFVRANFPADYDEFVNDRNTGYFF